MRKEHCHHDAGRSKKWNDDKRRDSVLHFAGQETLGKKELTVSVYVNNALAGELVIDESNNGGTLSLPISSLLLLDDTQNQVMLRCELWNASTVTPNDKRQLGFPLKSLRFIRK